MAGWLLPIVINMILFLFFCSGATALIYELLWSKYLSLMFGSTVQAQTAVLSVFMGGLAAGNAIFGRRSASLRQPLLAYGYIELAIAVYAFGFDWIYAGGERVFVALGSPLLGHSTGLLALKASLSVLLLAVPTVLMGGTLPMLAAWLQQHQTDSSRLSARFYSVNSLGAVFGAAIAGFYLIQSVGLIATAQVTALVNALVGATAVGIARMRTSENPAPAEEPGLPLGRGSRRASADEPETRNLAWAALLVAVTGGVSMGLEVLSSRALSLIFGSSLQAFALVLMAFILGIGTGASVVASPKFRRFANDTVVTVLLLSAAVWIAILIFKIESWVEFYRWSKTGLGRSDVGYLFHQILSGCMALVVLGAPAALIGAVLPLMMRNHRGIGGVLPGARKDSLGAQIGRLLTWNTVGAVVGVLVTGFFVMPRAGLRNSFATLAACLAAAALLHALAGRKRFSVAMSAAVIVAIGFVFVSGNENWRTVLSSGAFRSRETVYDAGLMQKRREAIDLIYYRDAADATVSIERSRRSGELFLRINGKTDASSRGDLSTQMLLAHLPMMARPQSKDVFVLGLGSGVTAGALLSHPLDRVTVAENCEPVIEGAKLFSEVNNGVLTNSRARILREDGRTVLKLSLDRYDVIISEPSNPWTAGVGSVFSKEFYQFAADRLKPGGVMAQWFHVYEMHGGIVSMVLRTFGKVFTHFQIWETSHGDIVLIGSRQAWPETMDDCRQVFARDAVRRQLEDIGLKTPEQVLARQVASQRTAFAIAGDGPVQSDYTPILEYEAPKAFYIGAQSGLLSGFDERTVQSALAPKIKHDALAGLDNDALRPIFAEFDSLNPELTRVLRWRLSTNSSEIAPSTPSVFRPTPTAVTDAQTNSLPSNEQFAQRARQSLGQDDYASARRSIELGLQKSPDDAQLNYLARILDREQPRVRLAERTGR